MIIKPPKLLKPENNGDEDNKIDILSIGYNGMISMEKKLCSKVLVHGYFSHKKQTKFKLIITFLENRFLALFVTYQK